MSRILFSLALILLASASTPQPSAATQKPAETQASSEADRLSQQVIELYSQGKYGEALPLAQRALMLRERESPADEELLAAALNNVAFTLVAAGKHKEAIAYLERSVGLIEKRFGREAPQLLGVLTKLAVAHFVGGQKPRTGDLLTRAVDISEKSYGLAHPSTLDAIFLLVDFYKGLQRYDEPEKLLLRAMGAAEKAGEAAREGLDQARGKYILLLLAAGRERDAESFVQKLRGAGAPVDPVESGAEIGKRAIFKAAPRYPAEAKANRDQGTVEVEILVDELGRVSEAKAISGPKSLRAPSQEAVRLWRFAPTFVGGVPVKVRGRAKVNFNLIGLDRRPPWANR